MSNLDLGQMTLHQEHETPFGHKQTFSQIQASNVFQIQSYVLDNENEEYL